MRPIKITTNFIDQIIEDFRHQLEGHRAVTDRINYTKTLSDIYKTESDKPTGKVKVYFTSDTYLQMMQLVNTCPDEVGWHGTVDRLSDTEFLIDKILVFPQIVSGTDVTPDEEEFAKWMMQFFEDDDDTTIQRMRFHGHSHVNMGTPPSGTDDNYQSNMLTKIKDYYIFLITNKRSEHNVMIYDIKNNIYYDKNDVQFGIILQDGTMLNDWASEQLKLVTKRYTKEKAEKEAAEKEKETRVVQIDNKKDKIYFDENLKLYVQVNSEGRKLYSHMDPRKMSKGFVKQFEIHGDGVREYESK